MGGFLLTTENLTHACFWLGTIAQLFYTAPCVVICCVAQIGVKYETDFIFKYRVSSKGNSHSGDKKKSEKIYIFFFSLIKIVLFGNCKEMLQAYWFYWHFLSGPPSKCLNTLVQKIKRMNFKLFSLHVVVCILSASKRAILKAIFFVFGGADRQFLEEELIKTHEM